jgi:hypothetical protein
MVKRFPFLQNMRNLFKNLICRSVHKKRADTRATPSFYEGAEWCHATTRAPFLFIFYSCMLKFPRRGEQHRALYYEDNNPFNGNLTN